MSLNEYAFQKCISAKCGTTFGTDQALTSCPQCGNLLDVQYEWDKLQLPSRLADFEKYWSKRTDPARRSGVWRFHDLIPFASIDSVVTLGEGQTILQRCDGLAPITDLLPGNLFLQYEGLNPSGSFKDNGMTAAITHAAAIGAKSAACASTGNTSASLAMYAGVSGLLRAIIFVGSGKIAYGKLSQALDYGALTLQISGDFDDAMARVREVCPQLGIYLVNSVNPFRLEGQKSIMLRVLEGLNWEVPDWIVVPGGNLGNSSSFGKCFAELKQLGLIDKVPRLAVIQAAGASTLDKVFNGLQMKWDKGQFDIRTVEKYFRQIRNDGEVAKTIASAIEINLPVNLSKCLRALEVCNGVVRTVTDKEILDAKALIGKHGFGCEPASAASVAGLMKLRTEGIVNEAEKVVCILTGHQLKDPNATVGYHTEPNWRSSKNIGDAPFSNQPVEVENNTEQIVEAIKSRLV